MRTAQHWEKVVESKGYHLQLQHVQGCPAVKPGSAYSSGFPDLSPIQVGGVCSHHLAIQHYSHLHTFAQLQLSTSHDQTSQAPAKSLPLETGDMQQCAGQETEVRGCRLGEQALAQYTVHAQMAPPSLAEMGGDYERPAHWGCLAGGPGTGHGGGALGLQEPPTVRT
ncbi:UNVERIFIED_CONTAM: hypothetical protein FKN15_065087 [Acipenser sinensis]